MYDSAAFEFLYFAGMLLVAACQWLGLLKLAGTERKGIWLTMLAGSTLFTISMLGLVVYLYLLRDNPGAAYGPEWTMAFQSANAAYVLGELLFVLGFVLHCMALSKSGGRVRELENIIAAQAEELDRLRKLGR